MRKSLEYAKNLVQIESPHRRIVTNLSDEEKNEITVGTIRKEMLRN